MSESEHNVFGYEVLPGMTVYFLRIIKRGPAWTPESTPELERLQAAHLAYGRKLIQEGKIVLNGPLLDGGFLRGVSVMRASSLAEAQALADGDPAVQVGRLACDVHPWMVQQGILPE